MSKFSDSVVSAVNNNSSSAVNVNNSSNLLLLVASFSGLGWRDSLEIEINSSNTSSDGNCKSVLFDNRLLDSIGWELTVSDCRFDKDIFSISKKLSSKKRVKSSWSFVVAA